jgi:hypothetical protein
MQKKRRVFVKMIVYHGSYTEIKKIDLSKATASNDFGKGFYVTNIYEHAKIMAERQGESHNCAGAVSAFEFDYYEAFSDEHDNRYKTKKFDEYTREWLDFIVENRENKTGKQIHEYDIVEGPVADDRVRKTVPKYAQKLISADDFLKILKHHEPTHQICFCTGKSLNTIERTDIKPHIYIGDIGESIINYLIKNDNISEQNAWDTYYESETYKNVSDENTELYKKTWEEILCMLKKEFEVSKTI